MIEVVNIRTNERRKLDRPHQIGAYINSSDLGPNSNKGQDFGWRLAPELMARIDEMRMDDELLADISKQTGVPLDELTTINLVQHISYEEAQKERAKEMRAQREPEYQKQYEAELAEARKNLTPVQPDETAPKKK